MTKISQRFTLNYDFCWFWDFLNFKPSHEAHNIQNISHKQKHKIFKLVYQIGLPKLCIFDRGGNPSLYFLVKTSMG